MSYKSMFNRMSAYMSGVSMLYVRTSVSVNNNLALFPYFFYNIILKVVHVQFG